MRKVVKISIGDIAFTIEEDAYVVMRDYISSLNDHYGRESNGEEIVRDIEERAAELLVEKAGKGNVLQISVVREVISILGVPDAIDPEDQPPHAMPSESIKKRLYRNSDHKSIGGVCSGLATYFGLDIAIVRIIFVILLIGFSIFGYEIGGFLYMALIYTVLWMSIPEARTVRQKFEMYGEPIEIRDIHKKFRDENYKNKKVDGKTAFVRLFEKTIGVILVTVSISGLFTLILCLFGIDIITGLQPFQLIDYVETGISNSFWLKCSLLLALFLPFLGMLYGGIVLLFSIRAPKFRPGLIIFLLWLVSLISLAVIFARVISFYSYSYNYVDKSYKLDARHDTLYIKIKSTEPFSEEHLTINAYRNSLHMAWLINDKEDYKIVSIPDIGIIREDDLDERHIGVRQSAFDKLSIPTVLSVEDSLITINAEVYDKQHKWKGEDTDIWIYIPKNVKVIIQEPIDFQFDRSIRRRLF